MRRALILGAVMAGLLGTARAEDVATYEVEGDAELTGGDPRVAALDEAFANAVRSAVADLVDADARAAKQADIDREIVGRARLWVAKFTVTKDTTVGDRRQLSVSVRVDRDKLLVRLGELEVSTRMGIVLMRFQDKLGVVATFGQGGDKDVPGLAALNASLRTAGVNPKRAPLTGPRVRTDGVLPLADDEALALVTEAKADMAIVVGVTVGPEMPVRGYDTYASAVTATVRAIEKRGTKVLGQGTAIAGAVVKGPSNGEMQRPISAEPEHLRGLMASAINRAVVAAVADAIPRPPTPTSIGGATTFSGSDMPIREPGMVLVRVAPKTPWGLVAAELKYLQGAKGVKRAVVRRVSPGGWVIGVATAESVDKIATIVKKSPAPDVTSRVKMTGDIIDVSLGGAP